MQKTDELTTPAQIHSYYLVPCDNKYNLPLLLPFHNDIEHFNVAAIHAHYDYRFFNQRDWRKWWSTRTCFHHSLAQELGICNFDDLWQFIINPGHDAVAFWGMVKRAILVRDSILFQYEKRMCLRQVNDFDLAYNTDTGASSVYQDFQNAYKDTKSICGKCPHKGVNLAGVRPVNGVVTCPAHGLKFNYDSIR